MAYERNYLSSKTNLFCLSRFQSSMFLNMASYCERFSVTELHQRRHHFIKYSIFLILLYVACIF